jgi:hypothetical protein
MPIFVSRFSAERIASAGLRRVRNQDQSDRRERIRESRRTERAEQSNPSTGTAQTERAQDQLPVATQQAESIRDQVREEVEGALTDSADESTTDTTPSRPTFPIQATLPGVPTVSSGAGSEPVAARQVGRLDQASSRGIRSGGTSGRFSATANARSSEVRQAFQSIPSEAQSFEALQASRLNTQIDATIRLLRSRSEQTSTAAAEPADGESVETPVATTEPVAVEPQAQAEIESSEAVSEIETPVAAVETPPAEAQRFPSAEQISRANTTSEIQENLRSNSSEIEQGLRADAEIQAQANQRQTEVNAERSSEANRESTIDQNDETVRDLTVHERQLQQSLRATQSEIRDLNNESNRLESSGSNATAATAANLAAQAGVV